MPSAHSARILSLIALLAMPLFTQATTVTPTEHQGTWENKDEDRDGVPDELDDYPFDKDKSSYEVVVEEEFNNNLAVANVVESGVPFRVHGAIQQKLDMDLFKFNSTGRKAVTVVLKSENSEFEPYVTIFNNSGESLTPVPTNYTPVGIVRSAVTFTLTTDGTYYLVVNDKQRRGAPDYTYQVHIFEDKDVDGLDDSLEPAFGLSNIVIDTDNDKIFDANEFYAYDYSDIYSHDVDKDGIPNWLDDDSDGDGILDSVEGVFDLERDGFASFVDLDSDGNGENDDSEVGSTNMMPKDSDNDGLYNFLDVDDDNDGLLDIHDNDPLNALKVAMPGEPGYRNIVYISYIYNSEAIHDIHIAEEAHSISGRGLIGTGFLVFDMGKEIPPLNIPVTSNNSENITFLMPRNAKSIYFVANGFRSNRVAVNYSNEQIAIINALNEQYFTEGTRIELTGNNFFEDTKVLIDDLIVEPSINSTSSLTFILPSGLSPEVKISLKTTYGKSNSRVIKVGKNVALTIVEPNSINIDTTKLFAVSYQSPTKKRYPVSSMHSTSVIVGSGYDIIVVMHQDEHGVNFPYLYRTVFDIPLETSISPLDSAISVAWYKSGIRRSVPTTEWINTYKAIGELAATRTLAEYIASHMDNLKYTANPDYIALERFAVEATRVFSRELYNAQKENLKAKINNVAS
ncbi:MSCRAMM family adhesin SdrC [Shewanella baltica]|uniref:MSCRAMM family adhesin SdrC n=1 Tax=Shewanella baltica TaxID=62322 RepID=UPI00217ED7B5|nr:MSCRAMM family adhesin SdrC [Shewanella baltica]MCS6241160.1 hypothetical protein [Shewanella baltica]